MTENNTVTIVRRFKVEQGLTLRQMAAELGVSHPTVYNWMTGRSRPSTDYLLSLYGGRGNGWRKEFAEAILRQRLPGMFAPDNFDETESLFG